MNYYPIENDEADLEYLLKRWKTNKIFSHLSDYEISELMLWHSMQGYIKPYFYENYVPGLLSTRGDKVFIVPINLFNGYEKEKVSLPMLDGTRKFVESDVKSISYYSENEKFSGISKHIPLRRVYISKSGVKSIESGEFKKLSKEELRKAKLKEFLINQKKAFPGELTRKEAWGVLNEFDNKLFPPISDSTIKNFFETINLSFKTGRRSKK